ncbi:MAG: phage head closure protein [Pseudomonadota bacterium]|jgi:SPP1 family predicted phage head-tail adaptor
MIGGLRQRVKLQRRISTPDGGGGADSGWADIAEVWAEVTPTGGREAQQGMRLASLNSYRVRLRFRADVSTADRMLFDGRILNIRSLINMASRGRWLECVCEEGADS